MPFLGMRGSGDFTVTGQRPENWREMVLWLYPNGHAPLTALLAKLKSEKTDDPIFHWFQQELPDQIGAVTGVFGGTNLSDAYAAAVVGDTFYVKMSAANAAKFNVSHQVMLVINNLPSTRLTAKVTVAPVINGASSYITCILLEADGSSTKGGAIHTAAGSTNASLLVIGSVNPEGGTSPASLIYDPNELSSYTQIFRNSLDQTRTAMKTRLRTGDQVKEAKRQALEMHSIEQEKAYWFSALSVRTGANNKPERTTRGIRNYLTTNVSDFSTSTSATWAAGGKAFLDAYLEQLFRYGNTEKIAFCGSGALMGIQQMVEADGDMTITPGIQAYGIKVVTLNTVFGTLHLKLHPLFTLLAPLRYSMGILDPPHLVYRFVDDTKYLPNRQANDLDGEKSEFLTEAGLEVHFEKAHGWLDGIGLNGTLSP